MKKMKKILALALSILMVWTAVPVAALAEEQPSAAPETTAAVPEKEEKALENDGSAQTEESPEVTAAPEQKATAAANADTDLPQSGVCEKNLTWILDAEGTLTIQGMGGIEDFDNTFNENPTTPWCNVKESIKKIIIKDGVVSIGSSAFYGCSNLNGVEIPDSLKHIGWRAFGNCSSLNNVKIPDSVTSIYGHAFSGCRSLSSVKIPDGLTEISWGTFSGCSNLNSVVIPERVKNIDRSAFYRCNSLSSVEIPDSVTHIGEGAFSGCSSLRSLEIPDSVISISGSAFSGCNNLNSVKIPNNLNGINESVFSRCRSLSSVVIPSNVTHIGRRAFSECSSLKSLEIPGSVRRIDDSAFKECSNLSSVKILDGVINIGDSAFYGCSSLSSVIIPDSVTSIDSFAFLECSQDLKIKGYSGSYAETYADEKSIPFIALNAGNADKTSTVLIPGQSPDKYLSGMTNYGTKGNISLANGSHIKSQFVVNAGTRLDVPGGSEAAALTVDSGGELVVDGAVHISGALIVKGGGKVTVRSGGKLYANQITVEGGFWGFGSGVLEIHTDGFADSDGDLKVKNDAYVCMYAGSKLIVEGVMNMHTSSDKSQFYGGDLFIGKGLSFKGNGKNFQATSDHSTIFYQKSYSGDSIAYEKQNFRFGNLYVENDTLAKDVTLAVKAANYCGRFGRATNINTKNWSYHVAVKNYEPSDYKAANWSQNVDQVFTNVANSGAFKINCDRMNLAQQEALNKMVAVWVTSLQMPVYDGMEEVGSKKFAAEIKVKLKDNQFHKAVLYCDAFSMGSYAKFFHVTMDLEEHTYSVGFGAKGDIEKYAVQAGEYVRDEFLDEYFKYADGALGGLFSTWKGKVSWGTAKSFIKKVLCKQSVTKSDDSIQDIYKNAEKKVTDYIQIIDLELSALDAMNKTNARAAALMNEEVQETPTLEMKQAVLKNAIQQESDAKASMLTAESKTGYVEVKDAQLKKALEPVLGTDESGNLDYSKCSAITYLSIGNAYIRDLTGLENFENLTMLMMGGNQVTDLTPIGGLSSLKYLDISGMYLKDLNVLSNMTALESLTANDNELTDIAGIKNLTALKLLNIENNQIKDIAPVAGLNHLETLSVSNNPLSSGGLDAAAEIASLQVLEAAGCGLSSVKAFNGSALQNVNLKVNDLKELSCFKNAESLMNLDVSGNKLTDISALSGLTQMQKLNLADNGAIQSMVPLAGLTALTELNLAGTLMVDADLDNLKAMDKLRILNVSDNPICSLGCLRTLEALGQVDISDTALDEVDQSLLRETGVNVICSNSQPTAVGIYFPKETLEGTAGSVVYQEVCTYPFNSNTEAVQWQSSDTSVAEVLKNGMVTMKKEGIVTITASLGDMTCSYTLNVIKDEGTLLLGDINEDTSINASDALLALRHAVKEITLEGDAFTRGDVTFDQSINASDALQILRYAVKEISDFK